MAKQFDGAYLEMVNISADSNVIRVGFASGDEVEVRTGDLSHARRRTSIDWTRARLNGAGTTILVPADPSDLEIPATRIRRLTDKKFAKHLAKVADDQAKTIGSRLKSLRERRGLTQKQVAQAAGLEPANLSRIESGRFDVSSTTLWRVLAAMDCSIADLVSPNALRSRDYQDGTPAGL